MEVPEFPVIVKEEVWPDANERQQIRDFFKAHCPEVLILPDTQSAEAKHTLEGLDEIGSLGGYRHLHKKSWFESEGYLDFVDLWRHLRDLLDSIIARQLDLRLFTWFRTDALHWKEPRPEGHPDKKGYTLSVSLMNPEGNLVEPTSLWANQIPTVPLGEWNVKESRTIPQGRYGIYIDSMLYEIHRCIIRAMEDSTIFGRCAAEKTPKRPACQNIFLHSGRGRNKDYCLTQCRKRDYMAKKRKKSKA